jgi:hypothetical protein
MKPVGETEFVSGTAAMSASGQYGRRGSAERLSDMPIYGSATGLHRARAA